MVLKQLPVLTENSINAFCESLEEKLGKNNKIVKYNEIYDSLKKYNRVLYNFVCNLDEFFSVFDDSIIDNTHIISLTAVTMYGLLDSQLDTDKLNEIFFEKQTDLTYDDKLPEVKPDLFNEYHDEMFNSTLPFFDTPCYKTIINKMQKNPVLYETLMKDIEDCEDRFLSEEEHLQFVLLSQYAIVLMYGCLDEQLQRNRRKKFYFNRSIKLPYNF